MRFNLSSKLIISHLGMGVLPLLFISLVIWFNVSGGFQTLGEKGVAAVEHVAREQLRTMCSIKEKQVAYFFRAMEGQMYMLRDNSWLHETFNALNREFKLAGDSVDSDDWKSLELMNDVMFQYICVHFDWNNLYLINKDGKIIYSMLKSSDMGLSLAANPLRNTSLGRAYSQLKKEWDQDIAFGDYAPYPPLDNLPSAFLVTRIYDTSGETKEEIGYLAIQPSTEALRNTIKLASNKKESLEAYLVGADGYMRSDSVLDPENYSRAESFRQGNKVNTVASRNAIAGEKGTGVINDYRGKEVLSSWTPIDVFTTRWALICEVDEAEAMAARTSMNEIRFSTERKVKAWIYLGLILTCIIVSIVAWLIVRSISRPIVQAAGIADSIAAGDFHRRLDMQRSDEIGQMADALDRMVEKVSENFQEKAAMADLSDQMRGEQDIPTLSMHIANHLAKFLRAQMASLYLVDHDGETLTLKGSYAFHKRKGLNSKIRMGEGIAGQAAFENNMISVTDLPEDYVRINSTLGDAAPCNILAIPFSHEEKVLGVLEFASFTEFSDEQMDFLGNVTEHIAIAFRSAQNKQDVQKLLDETREQAEELKQQSEELMATNEELESQTMALKKFQQELEKQQDELKETNAALEEKSEALMVEQRKIKESNEELVAAKEKIEERSKDLALASKYKSEFLANMSHELRTPLNSLLLLAQSLRDNREGNLTPKQQQSAGIIFDSGNDLLDLINEILDLSKIEAGQIVKDVEEVFLTDLAENAKVLFGHMAENKGLDFSVTLADDLPRSIFTDRKRIEQILKNFLGNSMKFTAEGGIDLVFSRMEAGAPVQSESLRSEESIAIAVKDTGIGIPAEKQRAIFEAFQQADGSTARKYGGTGLGLSISKELAALLGGEIVLHSEPGKGSTFTLYLPIGTLPEPDAGEEGRKEAPQPNVPLSRGARAESRQAGVREEKKEKTKSGKQDQQRALFSVSDDRDKITENDRVMLVIEDDPKFAEILLEQCRESDFKALVTDNGEDGLQLAEKYRPSGIILDIRLPGIDGWTVLNSLKSNGGTRHIPVHMMSAEEVSRKAMNLGAIGFLSKPVNHEQLSEAFERFESVINKKIKKLLVVEDDDTLRSVLVDLVGNTDTDTYEAKTGKEVEELLGMQRFDCMVLDLGLPDCNGIDLLHKLADADDLVVPPVIIYTGRELSRDEERELNKYSESIIIKDARSQERLLDETSLFLHRMVESLPPKKQQIIADLYDRDKMFQGKKVLLVDDDMRNVFALSGILEQKGMDVVIAEDGRRALDALAQEEHIDIVLMDIMMPEMDGYEATRNIREQKQFWKLPVIALTAKAMKEDRDKCLEVGASDYLAKPVDVERLLSMMRVWLYR
ncbi:MAG: response regulator [Candidatus Electrothrix aestuarii]|uniref:histidine kinase n=1 Tax=Candidatus Electrothrix aestuarii TaxID=3062594 RepID=A0AAU8M2A4_9BACT|nr:response regulator [Candidatus Electrothrix aestuarii]